MGNMDQKIILRFRNSSKAGTSQEIPAGKFPNITIGRDPSCEVAFDPDKDDLVTQSGGAGAIRKSIV